MYAADAEAVGNPAQRRLKYGIAGKYYRNQQYRRHFIQPFIHTVKRQQRQYAGIKKGKAENAGSQHR